MTSFLKEKTSWYLPVLFLINSIFVIYIEWMVNIHFPLSTINTQTGIFLTLTLNKTNAHLKENCVHSLKWERTEKDLWQPFSYSESFLFSLLMMVDRPDSSSPYKTLTNVFFHSIKRIVAHLKVTPKNGREFKPRGSSLTTLLNESWFTTKQKSTSDLVIAFWSNWHYKMQSSWCTFHSEVEFLRIFPRKKECCYFFFKIDPSITKCCRTTSHKYFLRCVASHPLKSLKNSLSPHYFLKRRKIRA